MQKETKKFIRLDTQNTSLLFSVDGEKILSVEYYGKKLTDANFEGLFSVRREARAATLAASSFGEYDFRSSSLLAEYANGTFVTRLRCFGYRFTQKPDISPLPSARDADETLEFDLRDEATGLSVRQYFSVYKRCDAVTSFCLVRNGGKEPCHLRKAMSLQLDLAGDLFKVTTFNGAWGRERIPSVRETGIGIFRNDSKSGASSAESNPLLYVEETGGARRHFAFNLIYSGNHLEEVEVTSYNRTRILIGINDFMFRKKLEAGQTFATPEAVMCFAPDEDSLSRRFHFFVSEHIVRGKWKKRERPVLVNNWEGTYFDFNEEKLLAIAEAAKEAGAELFVLDDGWFGKRNSDTCSLGDWYDNVEKTGGGLASLSAKIHALGLSFGIWVEPEMISEDSDLYRAHSNFAMKVPGRTPARIRNQLMLNMADERVQNYVVRTISDVISRCGADYVKWDFNRSMTDCFGKGIFPGEYFHRYMLGYYRVVSKIVKKFPFVLFEGCAGGGGRFDLGNLCYFCQYWTSDDTDARMRIAIQAGSSYGYPHTVMGAHVSACPNHQTGNSNSLDARFNVACGGVLGYELDMTKFTPEEKQEVAEQIAFYKENRKLLQFGEQYRIDEKFVKGFITVSKDKGTAILVVNLMTFYPGMPVPTVRLKGLSESAMYEVTRRDGKGSFVAEGDLLMNGDLPLPDLFDFDTVRKNSGGLCSRMYLLKKRKN